MKHRWLTVLLTLGLLLGVLPAGAAGVSSANRVRSAVFRGSRVTVEYESEEDAVLLAAAYTEDGRELTASGIAEVPAAVSGRAKVGLTGELPEVFQLRVFLLGRDEPAPLAPAYSTTGYARNIENLRETEADDFAADRVFSLSENSFAVVRQGVVVCRYQEGKNRLLRREDSSLRYAIAEADDRVKALEEGDLLALEYEPGELLVLRVETAEEGEDAVLLTGDDELEWADIFEAVRLEETVADLHYDPAGRSDGVTAAQEADGSFRFCFEDGGLRGEGRVKLDGTVSFYSTMRELRAEMKFSTEWKENVESSGEAEGEFCLGTLFCEPAAGLRVQVSPVVHWETDGTMKAELRARRDAGVRWNGSGFEDLSRLPGQEDVWLAADAPGTVRWEVELCPEASLWQGTAVLRTKDRFGAESRMERGDPAHGCLAGTRKTHWETVAEGVLLFCPWQMAQGELTRAEGESDTFYNVPDSGKGGWGRCPEDGVD